MTAISVVFLALAGFACVADWVAVHREAKFLEYLASPSAQEHFANGNNEWPVVKSAVAKNAELDSLGRFKMDPIGPAVFGKNTPLAQRIVDRAGWR